MSENALQTLLNNIMSELKEIRGKIDNLDEKLMDRINDLETRVTILETQINTTKSIFSSGWFKVILGGFITFLSLKIPGASVLLDLFK